MKSFHDEHERTGRPRLDNEKRKRVPFLPHTGREGGARVLRVLGQYHDVKGRSLRAAAVEYADRVKSAKKAAFVYNVAERTIVRWRKEMRK